ncbi:MAG: hypothetical protein AB1635_21450 [Acidobacteriota bacterium]
MTVRTATPSARAGASKLTRRSSAPAGPAHRSITTAATVDARMR